MPNRLPSALLLTAVGLLAACGGNSSSPSAPEALAQVQGNAPQAVCHLAQTKIDVLLQNLEFHIKHGDWLIGPEVCDGQDNDCNGVIDDGGVCDGGDGDGGASTD